jgi:hypothetical protein
MIGIAPIVRSKYQRFSLQCRGLTLQVSIQNGLKIALTRSKHTLSLTQPRQTSKAGILPVLSCSGPFFVYADAEQAGQDEGVDRRFSVVGFQHHIKMDHT